MTENIPKCSIFQKWPAFSFVKRTDWGYKRFSTKAKFNWKWWHGEFQQWDGPREFNKGKPQGLTCIMNMVRLLSLLCYQTHPDFDPSQIRQVFLQIKLLWPARIFKKLEENVSTQKLNWRKKSNYTYCIWSHVYEKSRSLGQGRIFQHQPFKASDRWNSMGSLQKSDTSVTPSVAARLSPRLVIAVHESSLTRNTHIEVQPDLKAVW